MTERLEPIVLRIDFATLWEEARGHAYTSDNWPGALEGLRKHYLKEEENGRTPIYDACKVQDLLLDGYLRPMTDAEIETDAPCPFYEPAPTVERKPEEVAARVGAFIHALVAIATHSHPELIATPDSIVCLGARGESLGEPSLATIKTMLASLCDWAADGADEATRAALARAREGVGK